MSMWTEIAKNLPIAIAVIGAMLVFIRAMARRDHEYVHRQEQWFRIWKGVVEENTLVVGRIIERIARSDLAHARDLAVNEKQRLIAHELTRGMISSLAKVVSDLVDSLHEKEK